MTRYFKLYRLFLGQHFKTLMEYRASFLLGAISHLILQAASIAAVWVVMRQVPSIEIPAGGEVKLMAGSLHVMLFSLTRDLKTGDTVDFTLQFEKAGPMPIKASVRQP